MKYRERSTINAKVVDSTDTATLQGLLYDTMEDDADVYTDEAAAYKGMVDVEHETVKHSVAECVNGIAHTNNI